MQIQCSLTEIKEFLEKQSLSCSIEKTAGKSPLEYLEIDMGVDEKGRPVKLDLFIIEKDISGIQQERTKQKSPQASFLNIRYFCPFTFQPEAVNEIARFLLLINKTLDFTGFGMSEPDRSIYFRHDLFCHNSMVNTEILQGLLGYILLMADSFGTTIEQLSSKEKTFLEVVETALKSK